MFRSDANACGVSVTFKGRVDSCSVRAVKRSSKANQLRGLSGSPNDKRRSEAGVSEKRQNLRECVRDAERSVCAKEGFVRGIGNRCLVWNRDAGLMFSGARDRSEFVMPGAKEFDARKVRLERRKDPIARSEYGCGCEMKGALVMMLMMMMWCDEMK